MVETTEEQQPKRSWQAWDELARPLREKRVRDPIVFITWALIIGLALFDLVLAVTPPTENTLSEVLRVASQRYPVLPWLLGLLLGHLFHNGDDRPPFGGPWGPSLTFLITILALAWRVTGAPFPERYLGAVAVAGVAAGYLLWPIKRPAGQWNW